MSYCSLQDLINRFNEQDLIDLTDEHGTEEIDLTKVASAIADVDSFIDSYLASQFALPFASVPAVLNQLACDIVRYRLYKHGAPEHITKLFNDAVSSLRAIGKGEMSLGLADPSPQSAGEVKHTTPGRKFTFDTLKGF